MLKTLFNRLGESLPPAAFKKPLNLVAILFPILTVILLITLPKATVKHWDIHLPFWIYLAHTFLLVVLLIQHGKDVFGFLQKQMPSLRHLLAGLALAIASTYLTASHIEARHRVQSDESIFLTTAQNLRYNQIAGACDQGEFTAKDGLHCYAHANNFKAKIQSWFYTLAMPFLGADLSWIFHTRLLLYFLTFIAIWLAVLTWIPNHFLALSTSALLMLQPTVMFQFRSASVEPLYIFLGALSIVIMRWTMSKRESGPWLLFALVLAFFAQTRQETVFSLFAFGFAILPGLLQEYKRPKDFRLLTFCIGLTVFSLPILLTIASYQGYGFQGGQHSTHGNFLTNLKINFDVMTQGTDAAGLLINPFLKYFTYTALLGVLVLAAYGFKHSSWKKIIGFLILFHLQAYMIFENVSGDFTIHINQRYSLVILPFMAFFSAILLEALLFKLLPILLGLKNYQHKESHSFYGTILVMVVIFGITFGYRDSLKANIMYRKNHLTAEEIAIHKWMKTVPENKLFIYARPWHFIGYHESAIHYNRFMNWSKQEQQEAIKKYQGNVYYIRGMDCWDGRTYHAKAVERRIGSICDKFENKFELAHVGQDMVTGSYRMSIFKVIGTIDYDANSALRPGIFHYTAKSGQPPLLQYSYATEKNSERLHTLQIFLNDSLITQKPFSTGSQMDSLLNAPIKPGYNSLQFTVLGKDDKVLFTKGKSAFFDLGIAEELHTHTPIRATQSWGSMQVNQTVQNKTMHIGGRQFTHGFGAHAQSHIAFHLNKKYSRFQSYAGIDDEEPGGDGVQFYVLGDGKVLWKSAKMLPDQLTRVDVSVQGVQTLELVADSLGTKDFDHINWALPQLIKEAE